MKKKCRTKAFFTITKAWLKSVVIMKLIMILLCVNLFAAMGTGYSQVTKFTLSGNNVQLQQVFNDIKEKSEFCFFYNYKLVDLKKRVNYKVKDANLTELLDQILDKSEIKYEIVDKTIILSPRKKQEDQSDKSIQERIITGQVTNEEGLTLPGVNIVVKGTTKGTTTDIDGRYSVTVNDNSKLLVFSFIGFVSQEVHIGIKSQIDVVLKNNDVGLDEVVVTALGIKKEVKALGYAVLEVKGDVVTAGKDMNFVSALSGRMPGVDISTTSAGPSGSTRILIRGNAQLSGSNQPLYVIDGIPMDNTQLGSAGKWGGYDFGDGLSSINPDDIESISILKGASASALYGSRASNGVVIITTKSSSGNKGIGVELNTSFNMVNVLTQFDDYQTVYGQGRNGELPLTEQESRSAANASWGPKLDTNLAIPIYNGDVKPYGVQPNNILSFFRRGLTVNNSLSLSSAGDKANVRVSMSNMQNTDIVPNSNMEKNSFMIKGGAKLNKHLSVEGRVNYTIEEVHNRPALSDSPNNVGLSLIGIPPNFHQKWLSENYKDQYGRYNDWNGGNIYRINPYWALNEMSNDSRKQRVMGHIQLKFDFSSYLSMQLKGGTDFYQFRLTDFSPHSTPIKVGGGMNELSVNVGETNAEALLRFTKKFFEKLDVSAFVGGNIMCYKSESFNNEGKTQFIPDKKFIGNYQKNELVYLLSRKQINSVYGAVNLGYKDMVYLDFTLRGDWSSTLSKEQIPYKYPSLSSSFVFTELIKKNPVLSFGKLRASWAEVGGDTSPYQLNLNYGLLSYTFKGLPLGEIYSKSIPNKNLKPTRTYSWEVGADLRFLKNRFALDVTYYNQSTKDQILSLLTSKTIGYESAIVNAGEITNKGVELILTANLVSKRDFNWSMTVNYAKNVNKVVKLHPKIDEYVLAEARWAGAFVKARENESYGVIVGKKMKRDPNGNVIHGANGLPLFGEKPEFLGNGVHDWTGGLNSTINYKGFTLSWLFDVKWGAEIYSMSTMFSHLNGTSKNTLEGRDAWYASEEQRKAAGKDIANWQPTGGFVGKGVINNGTEENPEYVTNDVIVNPQTYWETFYDGSPEPFIEDASFIKLREASLTYEFGNKILKRTPFVDASVSVFGRNLWLIYSNLKNIDPESNYNNGNGQGLEYGSIPSRRTYGLSLKLKF